MLEEDAFCVRIQIILHKCQVMFAAFRSGRINDNEYIDYRG
jgi:hypothetical protein